MPQQLVNDNTYNDPICGIACSINNVLPSDIDIGCVSVQCCVQRGGGYHDLEITTHRSGRGRGGGRGGDVLVCPLRVCVCVCVCVCFLVYLSLSCSQPLLDTSPLCVTVNVKMKSGPTGSRTHTKQPTRAGRPDRTQRPDRAGRLKDQPLTFKSKVKSSGYTTAPRYM